MRIHLALCLAAVCAGGAGCNLAKDGGSGSPTGPSGPPSAGSAVVYTVVGASDGVGWGSSKVCNPFEDCDGNGYAWVAARQLRSQGMTVELSLLAIPGAVLSQNIINLATQWGIGGIPGDLASREAPFVRKDSTVVTVFAGGNDVNVISGALANDAGASNTNAFIDQQVAAFGADFQAMIATIRGRAPNAQIIVLNLPNMARVPYRANSQPLLKSWVQRISVGMTTQVFNATPNVRVIDLMCDPRLYDPASFSGDGFHPSDAGYATMGQLIANAITAASWPAPQASCAYMN
jgi:lysophospholipase L1-like esterase